MDFNNLPVCAHATLNLNWSTFPVCAPRPTNILKAYTKPLASFALCVSSRRERIRDPSPFLLVLAEGYISISSIFFAQTYQAEKQVLLTYEPAQTCLQGAIRTRVSRPVRLRQAFGTDILTIRHECVVIHLARLSIMIMDISRLLL